MDRDRAVGAMHVAWVVPSLEGGGAERVVTVLANAMARAGDRVDVVVPRAVGPFVDDLSDDPAARVRLVDLHAGGSLRALPALRRYLRAARPDVLASALTPAHLLSAAARWGLPDPPVHICTLHGHPAAAAREAQGLRARVALALLPLALRTADGITAVSTDVRDEAAAVAGLPPAAFHVVPNPFDLSAIRQAADGPSPHPWLAEPGPVVVAAGRFTPEKGFADLLDAAVLLSRRSPVRWILLGDGPERPALERAAVRQDLKVAFPGFVRSPYAYFAHADVVAVPSRREGFGNVAVEALACGTPVVAVDSPGGLGTILQRDRARSGGEGWHVVPCGALTRPTDSQALARALAATLDRSVPPARCRARANAFDADAVCARVREKFWRCVMGDG